MGKGADANSKDKDNITALMEAAIMGHKDIADYLVKNKADVDSAAASGVTALWLASGEGKNEIVDFLVKKGADVNNKRMDGYVPQSRSPHFVIPHTISEWAYCNHPPTPHFNDSKIRVQIHRSYPPQPKPRLRSLCVSSITALMAACVGGHLDSVKLLLGKGADVQSVDQDGLSAIMNAAENGSTAVVNYLIDNGASPTNMSSTGFTPLIVAAAGGHLGVVELLIGKGASVDEMHTEGVNALMYALMLL